MGLQAIFKAYESKKKQSKTPDAILPGMKDFATNQLFFLSFANLWCEVVDPSQFGRLRIINSVSNSDDFSRAYNCPVGSPMDPEKKCNYLEVIQKNLAKNLS